MIFRMHRLIGAAALLSSACAAAPEAIAPASMSGLQYRGWNCARLGAEHARLNRQLASLYTEQSQSRTDDVMGYLMLLRPVATMTGGDMRYQIALRKGELVVVEDMIARDCPGVR